MLLFIGGVAVGVFVGIAGMCALGYAMMNDLTFKEPNLSLKQPPKRNVFR